MASLYTKRGIYYLSVKYNKKRLTRSLGTKDPETAKQIRPLVERELLLELLNDRKVKDTPFPVLVEKYLSYDHGWKDSTKEINTRMLTNYLKRGYPENITSRAMTVRGINACNRWGYKNKLIPDYAVISGGNQYNRRTRVFSDEELKVMFQHITPPDFNRFVKFAYYTGARLGEIRAIKPEHINGNSILIDGKTGKRLLKLTQQAKDVLGAYKLWDYTMDYIEKRFRANLRRLDIKGARFHDLRRTFGYNLIRQGRPIYEVSKLLGHSSVTTTERHYAPLLTTEIEDFIL